MTDENIEKKLERMKQIGEQSEVEKLEKRLKKYTSTSSKSRSVDFKEQPDYIHIGNMNILPDQYYAIEEIYKTLTGKIPSTREDLLKEYRKVEVNDSGYVTELELTGSIYHLTKKQKILMDEGEEARKETAKLIVPENLIELKDLRLDSLNIKKLVLPSTLKKLENLNCAYTSLRNLVLGKLESLIELDCSINYLNKLQISKYSVNMKKINASCNKIRKVIIPKELKNLEKVDLSDNERGKSFFEILISKLDDEFTDVSSLSKKSIKRLDALRKQGVHVIY